LIDGAKVSSPHDGQEPIAFYSASRSGAKWAFGVCTALSALVLFCMAASHRGVGPVCGGLILLSVTGYLACYCYKAAKHGIWVRVWPSEIEIASARPPRTVSFAEIKGFLVSQAEEGSGPIYMFLKSGESFRFPHVEDVVTVCDELRRLTGTGELSATLERKLNVRFLLVLGAVSLGAVLLHFVWHVL